MPKVPQLTSELFYADEAGKMDVVAFGADAAKNSGMMKRAAFTATSNVVDMIRRIHADIFFQDRYLINEVNVKNQTRAKQRCVLYHVRQRSQDSRRKVRAVRQKSQAVSVRGSGPCKGDKNATAKYPMRRVVCKTVTIPGGYRDVNHEKLFSGQLPTRLVIGLVDNGVFNGVKTKNPLIFSISISFRFPCTRTDSNSMA